MLIFTPLFQATINLQKGAVNKLPGVTEDIAANPQLGFGKYIGGLMGAIMVIAALLVLLYFIWGAIEWITSGDDKGKTEKARTRITQAVIGIIVLSASTALLAFIQGFLGINFLRFTNKNAGSLIPRGTNPEEVIEQFIDQLPPGTTIEDVTGYSREQLENLSGNQELVNTILESSM